MDQFIKIVFSLKNKQKQTFQFTFTIKSQSASLSMERLKEKQLVQMKEQQQKQKQIYKHALDVLLHNQSLRILIQYSKQQLKSIDISKIQNINDYTPVSISRLIFAKELEKIHDELKKLPNQKCPLDHFLIIMLKVVKFPFEKTPFYLLGLKQMFRQIKEDEKDGYVSFDQIKNYVMGEVVNFNEETQHDTEFQIQFAENKLQDFLMHDNGVKKIVYSHDLHKYIVLDQNSGIIKIYDESMKMVSRFEPNKEKHNKKHPLILTFDYNEFGSKLGISLSNNTFSIIHLGNLLSSASDQAFRSVFLNQVVYKSESQIIKINFLSMMNKWLCIDQRNQIWIYDVDNYKEENENYSKKFKHPNDDYEIKEVYEFVNLAVVAFVINNEVWFYNETLSKKKFKKFSHCEVIKKFTYSEERNEFYLIGKDEKYITIFTLNKISGDPNKIWTFPTNQIIVDFELFPYHNSIVILDSRNNLKVYSIDEPVIQYQQNYDFIVKKKQIHIKFVKNSKTSFLIHATYILVMELKKVAIERDMDFVFQDSFFYDSNKQQVVFSVNGQIIGLSLMHGQIRKSIAPQNSNLDKHKAFHMAKNTEPFVIDKNDSLYQALYKTDNRYKEYKDYRKHVGIEDIKKSFYDQEYRMVLMISDSSIYLVRNDSQNNFTFKSCLLFQNAPHFTKYKYNQTSKHLIFLDSTNVVYLMKSYNFQFNKTSKLNIFKEWNEGQKMAIDLDYDDQTQVLMVLTNNGEFAMFNTNDTSKSAYVKIKDFLPYKLQSTLFTSFTYQKAETRLNYPARIFLYNQSGFLIEFELDQMLRKIVDLQQIADNCQKVVYIKETHEVDFQKLHQKSPPEQYKLEKSSLFKPDANQSTFIKVHDKPIVFSRRILLQEYTLLTVGEDGHIKLWGQNRKLYFDLKLPLMLKLQWNMNELHEKRNIRIITETNKFLQKMTDVIKHNEERHILHMDLKKKLKNKSEKIKINLDNPIVLEFENKDLEEIVMNNKKQIDIQYKTIDVIQKERRSEARRMNLTQRIAQPWRKKSQFKELYDKASPVDKYVPKFKEKMPFDLLIMRNDLHMDQSISPVSPIKARQKAKKEQLKILPELKNYLKSKELEMNNEKEINKQQKNDDSQKMNFYNPEDQNKFESCLFVKTERGPKKSNAFDQIDKYFWRKQHELLSKKWIPNKKNLVKSNNTLQPKADHSLPSHSMKNSQLGKVDPLKEILKIFQEHNKEALHDKRGRLIKIPKMEKESKKMVLKKI